MSMMEKEIQSQKLIALNLVKTYIQNNDIKHDINDTDKIIFVASGSSNNASLIGKYFLESIANIYSSVEYAAQLANSKIKTYPKDCLYVFVSQSGNSTDTVLCAQKIKQAGLKTLCITNNKNSSLNQICDYSLDIMAGIEQAIAATKTFFATVFVLYLLALKFAKLKNINIENEIKNLLEIENEIDFNPDGLKKASEIISKQNDFSLSGFDVTYPLALETALKIKETSYINTSSYPTGEFIHGHFAVLNNSKVFLTFLKDGYSAVEQKLLEKIKNTYKAQIVAITDTSYAFDYPITVKKGKSDLTTILNMIIALQLLALNVALNLKRDVDKPMGLDKIVGDILKENN